jgi:deazaflavin-dependent oxidoreductase (nitroreductase family)
MAAMTGTRLDEATASRGLTPLPQPLAAIVRALNAPLPTLNRWFMIPVQRLGLGAWIGTPIGGYVLLLRTRGRRTGLVREAPLSYFVEDGSAWVMAGFGDRTQWFRNLLADPDVEVWLPGRTVRCHAEEIVDPALRAAVLPRLVRATGLPGLLVGCNPWTTPDAGILEHLEGVPLVRITPQGEPLVAGPDDPGGGAWIWRQGVVLAAALGLLGLVRRWRRGRYLRPGPSAA